MVAQGNFCDLHWHYLYQLVEVPDLQIFEDNIHVMGIFAREVALRMWNPK